MMDIRDLIGGLPKIELHLHLEGAIRYTTYREFVGLDSSCPEEPWRRPSHRFSDLSDFLATPIRCLHKPEQYERAAYEVILDLIHQGVIYTEISFQPRDIPGTDLGFDSILAALCSARERASIAGDITVGFIAAFGRQRGAANAEAMVACAIDSHDRGVVGIDLHGDETAADAREFRNAFGMAREAGLGLRAHAGEAAGAQSVWETVRELGVHRLAHGVRAAEDDDLLDYIHAKAIVLDMCPTSNYKLRVVPSIPEHPIRHFFRRGIQVTVSSDDPLFFLTDVGTELCLLHERLGFSIYDLRTITLIGVDAAFAPATIKSVLREQVTRGFDGIDASLRSD